MARIAHFIDTRSFGGAERVMLDLCRGLPGHDHETTAFHFWNDRLDTVCKAEGIRSEQLPHHDWYRSKWSVAAFAGWFASELSRRKVDLLHSHLFGPITSGALTAAMAGIPHVGTLHDTYLVEEQPSRFRLLRCACASGTTLVTVANAMREYYGRLGPRMEFLRVYNGVDFKNYPARAEKQGRFTLINVGRLTEVKRHELLLDAMARTTTDVNLQIAGEGLLLEELQAKAASLGIAGRVEFLGFRSDIPALLAKADAFVLSSRTEGLSCSIMEAMAAGLPSIVTDVGGNRELVEQGVTGLLVPSGDPNALAAAIDSVVRDSVRAATMGRAARARAERLFSVGAMVKGYDDIYRSLL